MSNDNDTVPPEVEAEFDEALEHEAAEWETATAEAMREDDKEEETGDKA